MEHIGGTGREGCREQRTQRGVWDKGTKRTNGTKETKGMGTTKRRKGTNRMNMTKGVRSNRYKSETVFRGYFFHLVFHNSKSIVSGFTLKATLFFSEKNPEDKIL